MSAFAIEVNIDAFSESLTVTGDYTPGKASQTSGPPEICDEGWPEEIEIESVTLADVTIPLEAFSVDVRDEIYELCFDWIHDEQVRVEDDYAISRYEAMKEEA